MIVYFAVMVLWSAGWNQIPTGEWPGASSMSERGSESGWVGILVTERPACRVAFLEHFGPYWRIGPSVQSVATYLQNNSMQRSMFIRYARNPHATPPAELQAEIGFVLEEGDVPDSRFRVAEWAAEQLVNALLDRSTQADRRKVDLLIGWAIARGYEVVGPVVEFYPASTADFSSGIAPYSSIDLQVVVKCVSEINEDQGFVLPAAVFGLANENGVSGTASPNGNEFRSEMDGFHLPVRADSQHAPRESEASVRPTTEAAASKKTITVVQGESPLGEMPIPGGQGSNPANDPIIDSVKRDETLEIGSSLKAHDRGLVLQPGVEQLVHDVDGQNVSPDTPGGPGDVRTILEFALAGEYHAAAERLLPEGATVSEEDQAWWGQAVLRLTAACRGAASQYPNKGAGLANLAEALSSRYEIVSKSFRVDPLSSPISGSRTRLHNPREARKATTLQGIDSLLGRISHKGLTSDEALNEVARFMDQIRQIGGTSDVP